MKDLAGKTNTSSVRIKGDSAQKRLENWKNHFQNLLGKEARLPDDYTLPTVHVSGPLPINTSQFTLSELKAGIKQLKSSKAFGPDNIPALIWKVHTSIIFYSNSATTRALHTNLQTYDTSPRSYLCQKRATFR